MGIIQKLSALLRGTEEETRASEKHVAVPTVAIPQPASVTVSAHDSGSERNLPVVTATPEQSSVPNAGVKKVMIDEAGLSVLDLRELPSSRFRIVGSAYWVTDTGRYKHGGSDYLRVREPKNKWDPNAVAVYGKGRKVGHLTEAKAAALAPIFDELRFGAYRVGGTAPAPNSIRMWVDLPAIPKLRAFAKTVGKAAG